MTAAECYRRAHFYLGNVARYVTRPWKEYPAHCSEARTIFGASFGSAGWHHIRRTLAEYDADRQLHWRDSTLYRYLSAFAPVNTGAVTGVAPDQTCNLPLFVYPWGTFRKNEYTTRKSAAQSRFCGPSSDEFIAEEFARTIRLYEAIRQQGYRPWRFGNTFIGSVLLQRPDGERRFVILQGNHRFAILAHLGHDPISVRDCRGYLAVLREEDAPEWPLVRAGQCSVSAARRIFDFFFREDGHHIARALHVA